jgi:hypothetical protein
MARSQIFERAGPGVIPPAGVSANPFPMAHAEPVPHEFIEERDTSPYLIPVAHGVYFDSTSERRKYTLGASGTI